MDVIVLFTQPSFLENRSPNSTTTEQAREMIHIQTRFAGKLRYDFSPPNITTFGEEGPADSKVKFTANRLALLESTPCTFKSRQGGGWPIVFEACKYSFRFL